MEVLLLFLSFGYGADLGRSRLVPLREKSSTKMEYGLMKSVDQGWPYVSLKRLLTTKHVNFNKNMLIKTFFVKIIQIKICSIASTRKVSQVAAFTQVAGNAGSPLSEMRN